MQRWTTVAAVAVLAALPQAALWAAPLAGEQAAVHVLNRLAYGPRPGDIDKLRQGGVQAYIDEQLNPPPLLTGDDLAAEGEPPGPRYRLLLTAARDAQLQGHLRTHEEALAWVRRQRKDESGE